MAAEAQKQVRWNLGLRFRQPSGIFSYVRAACRRASPFRHFS